MHYYNTVIHPILKYTCTYPTQKLQSLWVKYTKCILSESKSINNRKLLREGIAFPYIRISINKYKRNEENRKLPLDKYQVVTVTSKIHQWMLQWAGESLRKNGICIVSEYLHSRSLLNTREKIVEKPSRNYLTPRDGGKHKKTSTSPLMWCVFKRYITFVEVLPKMHSLDLIIRHYHVNSNWGILQSNWSLLFKTVRET